MTPEADQDGQGILSLLSHVVLRILFRSSRKASHRKVYIVLLPTARCMYVPVRVISDGDCLFAPKYADVQVVGGSERTCSQVWDKGPSILKCHC